MSMKPATSGALSTGPDLLLPSVVAPVPPTTTGADRMRCAASTWRAGHEGTSVGCVRQGRGMGGAAGDAGKWRCHRVRAEVERWAGGEENAGMRGPRSSFIFNESTLQ